VIAIKEWQWYICAVVLLYWQYVSVWHTAVWISKTPMCLPGYCAWCSQRALAWEKSNCGWPCYVSGRCPHYRRLSVYELIDFNGSLSMQAASFTGLVAAFRFPTVKALRVSSVVVLEVWTRICEEECENFRPGRVGGIPEWPPESCYVNSTRTARIVWSWDCGVGCVVWITIAIREN
jgi:hypothetical protein